MVIFYYETINHTIVVSAMTSTPPDTCRIAPNIKPRPIRIAIVYRVVPTPSANVSVIMSNGIPATRPMISADDMITIKGCTLTLIIRNNNTANPRSASCNQLFWRSNKVTHYKFLLMNMCCNYFFISGALLDHGYTITIGFSAFNTYDVYIFFSAKRQKQAVIFPCSPPVFCIFLLSFIKKRFYNIQYV